MVPPVVAVAAPATGAVVSVGAAATGAVVLVGAAAGAVVGVASAPHALSTSSVALIMTTEARASHERLPVPVPVIFDSPLYKQYEVLIPTPHNEAHWHPSPSMPSMAVYCSRLGLHAKALHWMKYAIEEATSTFVLRMGKHLFRIALLHDTALIDKDDTIRH